MEKAYFNWSSGKDSAMALYYAMKQQMEAFKRRDIKTALFGDLYLENLRNRREENCRAQGIKADFPLWGLDTKELLLEFINLGLKSIIPLYLTDRYLKSRWNLKLSGSIIGIIRAKMKKTKQILVS